VDALRVGILILHAKVQRDRLRERVAFLEGKRSMTPKVQGVASALAKLHHSLDARAGQLLDRIAKVDAAGDAAFKKANGRLDVSDAALAEVEKLVADLEQTNGGPSLDGSEKPSKEPEASWGGKAPGA
jgi:hypothetical protein